MEKKISFTKEDIEIMVLRHLVERGYKKGELNIFSHTNGVSVYVKEDE